MIFPVRCFTCGKVIGPLHERYTQLIEQGANPSDALREIHVYRYCCRRLFLTDTPLIDKLIQYPAETKF